MLLVDEETLLLFDSKINNTITVFKISIFKEINLPTTIDTKTINKIIKIEKEGILFLEDYQNLNKDEV
jgi:hypothetical protein